MYTCYDRVTSHDAKSVQERYINFLLSIAVFNEAVYCTCSSEAYPNLETWRDSTAHNILHQLASQSVKIFCARDFLLLSTIRVYWTNSGQNYRRIVVAVALANRAWLHMVAEPC